MPVFNHRFVVRAPLSVVANFHRDTRTLRQLTPPPMFVQLHHFDPLADGAVADFTLWFGPLPIRWVALHTDVDPQRGFTDSMQRGPMARWVHQHRFTALGPDRTEVTDRVEYTYRPGLGGLIGRLFMAPPALAFLFAYRGWATRRACERAARVQPA